MPFHGSILDHDTVQDLERENLLTVDAEDLFEQTETLATITSLLPLPILPDHTFPLLLRQQMALVLIVTVRAMGNGNRTKRIYLYWGDAIEENDKPRQ